MDTNRKLFLFTTTLLLLFSIAIMINAGINFRQYAYKNAIEKSKMTAEIVRDGLTAHMINGIMDKRAFFLRSIANTKDVKNLWIIRAKSVIDQFGEGLSNEHPRDEIDRKVLKTGEAVRKIFETTDVAILRVTIPYKASAYSEPNCLECHNVKEGETLGAISLEFDISDVRKEGIFTLLKIAAITLVFILIAMLAVKILFRPYLEFFNNLQESLKRARNGDFSLKVTTNIQTKDIRLVADLYNQLIEKFQNTIGTIEQKLAILLKNSQTNCSDPLEKSSNTIDMLSKIHHFKNTIELDKSLPQIYNRIAHIIRQIMETENFIIYNVESKDNTREIAYSNLDKPVCEVSTFNNASKCRAFRTMNIVLSDQFPELCPYFCGDFKYYHCIPYQVTESFSLVITLLTNDKKQADHFKRQTPTLNYYLENAKPVIESKLLMEQLRQKSLHDGLTGLYNRKFLEEFIDQVTHQAERQETKYGVLMLDIDFFKKVNDTYGHDVGDKFIKLLADTVKSIVRDSDIVARYGGEEFVVLLHESTPEGAIKVAEKIRTIFAEKSIYINGEHVKKSISIGVAFFPSEAETIREAIKHADVALYKAKERGRNRVIVFEQSMFKENSY
ncbi:GGDEF domain-containing protein [Hydrogenimonas thermophila]|uniref:GGDEF domain-containing protein n=1 Tax=Hydrogenimonas thermophila TaxID=223786 RepID=UPI002937124B|nr:GGDEF domain-containing protein [Hydrogenimonas thermophila]WOE70945.1 GGDEF domain-containing protein [Hydrogenimonas thermophila]WOE73463.1 GGDEF domain-containing protein [Hydrogenimonas thermophila]